MLEINSEWYGKTVYFRVHESGQKWKQTGTAINVPAYTELTKDENGEYIESSSGTRYKKAITILNPYVIDTGAKYKEYLEIGAITTTVSHPKGKGWLLDENRKVTDNHITVYAVSCETFNNNPQQFMVDAEGNYRMDSVAWGVCTGEEPDISGKSYWALKDYIANGYGLLIGHDTMYAYAGAYYDAFGVDLNEEIIDPNDGTTWYYDLNSWMPGTTASTYERDEAGNPNYLEKDAEFVCIVNPDSKYVISNVPSILKPGRLIIELMPQSYLDDYEKICKIKTAARKGGFDYFSNLIWIKMLPDIDQSLGKEKILLFSKGAQREFYLSSFLKNNDKTEKTALPTVFGYGKVYPYDSPQEVVAQILQFISADNPDFDKNKYLNQEAAIDKSFKVVDGMVIEKSPANYSLLSNTISALKEINTARVVYKF